MENGAPSHNLQIVRLTAKGLRWRRTGHPWVYRNDLEGQPDVTAGDLAAEADACRLIYGEADGFPGLVVDSYAGHLALQTLHPGMERQLPEIIDLLAAQLSP